MKFLKKIMIHTLCIFFSTLAFSCTSCSNPSYGGSEEKNAIFIVSYNAQTFFDAVEDGCEFKEFKGTKTKWSKAKYGERLERLKEAVHLACQQLGANYENEQKIPEMPDILVLQEIESKAVIEDFCKLLPYHSSYPYAVFIPNKKGGAFTTALLSKIPITETMVYELHTENKHLRPLVKTRLTVKTSEKKLDLVLFNVHWKSKVGTDESDKTRFLQEKQVYAKLCSLQKAEPDTPFIVCGDFNQPLNEFSLLNEFNNCWNLEKYKDAVLYGSQKAGSYCFKNNWEGIDHFFYSDNLKDKKDLDLDFFCVVDSAPLVDNKGEPARYSVFSGNGYSDHLPIGCVLKLQ